MKEQAMHPLEAEGYRCTTDDVLNVLLGVAVNATGTASCRETLQSVCTAWLGLAGAETVRGYRNDQLCVEELPELERRLNAALAT